MAQHLPSVKCLTMHLTPLDKPERSVGFSKGAPPAKGGARPYPPPTLFLALFKR